MNAKQIIDIASAHISESPSINYTHGVMWLNECQLVDLLADAMVAAETTVTVELDEWAVLPSDFLEPRYIEFDGMKWEGIFEIIDNKIKIPYSGTAKIYYYRLPATLANENDTPEANTLLHYPMAYYVIARYKFQEEDPTSEEGIAAMNEYIRLKNNVLQTLRRKNNQVRTIRMARWW